jgi:hypothetical protein
MAVREYKIGMKFQAALLESPEYADHLFSWK